MFHSCSRLAFLDVSGWDVSGASDLTCMFYGCSSLSSLDLSGWDVSSASDLPSMFDGCSSLTSLGVSGWDVSGASDLSQMFRGCSSLASLGVSGWDVSNASSFSQMFYGCSSLASLDLSGWDVSGASNLHWMFSDCSSLTSLDLSGWDVSSASDLSYMFSGCSSLGTVTLGAGCGPLVGELPDGPWYDAEGKEYDRPPAGVAGTFTKVRHEVQPYAVLYGDGLLSLQADADTDPSHGEVLGKWAWDGSSRPWYDECAHVESVVASDGIAISDGHELFSGLENCVSMYLSRLDVSGAWDLGYMFHGCSSLAILDLSGWDVSGASDLSYMFSDCSSLTSLGVSGWDVSNASDLTGVFYGCSSLGTVTLGAGCGPLVNWLPSGPWYDAEGKEFDRPPAGVAGTFTKTKPVALAVVADVASDADASLPTQIVEGEQDGLRYVVVSEGAPFEYGLEYPELAGRYVGPGAYLTGYAGEGDSLVVPLEVEGVPVVSANLSWNDSDRAGMTRLAAVSFERTDGKASSLAQLDVSGNGLSSLDIEGLDVLVRLNCEGNPITDLAALQAWAAQDGHEAKLPRVQDAAPAEPGDAAAPSEPSAPEPPTESDAPAVEPGEPSEPGVPAEPEVPSEPSEPEVPAEPEEPSVEPSPDEAPSDDSAASDEADLSSDSLALGEEPVSALAA